MRVLVACESSGVVREAFRARGHDAWSCDLLPADDGSTYHIQQDVLEVLGDTWDLMIAHPPCTYLCNSGVRWLHTEPGRWEKMRKAAMFFEDLLTADIRKICVENPIQHPHGCLPKYSQIIQPWQFGHKEMKATCLWLQGLDPLVPARWKLRSRTFTGIAAAMAKQWGTT